MKCISKILDVPSGYECKKWHLIWIRLPHICSYHLGVFNQFCRSGWIVGLLIFLILGIKSARKLYKVLRWKPPFATKLHALMVELELAQVEVNVEKVRQVFNIAVQQHGTTHSGETCHVLGVYVSQVSAAGVHLIMKPFLEICPCFILPLISHPEKHSLISVC